MAERVISERDDRRFVFMFVLGHQFAVDAELGAGRQPRTEQRVAGHDREQFVIRTRNCPFPARRVRAARLCAAQFL